MILETSILNPLKFLGKIFKADILLLGLTLEFAISKHIEIYTELHPSGLNFTLLTFEVRCCDINKCSSVFFLKFYFHSLGVPVKAVRNVYWKIRNKTPTSI